jgi:hypothetical protein
MLGCLDHYTILVLIMLKDPHSSEIEFREAVVFMFLNVSLILVLDWLCTYRITWGIVQWGSCHQLGDWPICCCCD